MQFRVIDDTFQLYNLMLNDIAQAKDYILLETYKFANDHMGERFRDALTKKAKEGVKIRILIDSWGKGPISEDFFRELISHQGEVKFFEKIKIRSDLFTRGNRRDHRKILVIDDTISYLGSANITGYNLNWRELSLRTDGELAVALKKVFMETFEAFNPYIISKKLAFTRPIYHGDFEIIRDVPSLPLQRIRKKYVQMIRYAKTSLVIETPYFLLVRSECYNKNLFQNCKGWKNSIGAKGSCNFGPFLHQMSDWERDKSCKHKQYDYRHFKNRHI